MNNLDNDAAEARRLMAEHRARKGKSLAREPLGREELPPRRVTVGQLTRTIATIQREPLHDFKKGDRVYRLGAKKELGTIVAPGPEISEVKWDGREKAWSDGKWDYEASAKLRPIGRK